MEQGDLVRSPRLAPDLRRRADAAAEGGRLPARRPRGGGAQRGAARARLPGHHRAGAAARRPARAGHPRDRRRARRAAARGRRWCPDPAVVEAEAWADERLPAGAAPAGLERAEPRPLDDGDLPRRRQARRAGVGRGRRRRPGDQSGRACQQGRRGPRARGPREPARADRPRRRPAAHRDDRRRRSRTSPTTRSPPRRPCWRRWTTSGRCSRAGRSSSMRAGSRPDYPGRVPKVFPQDWLQA